MGIGLKINRSNTILYCEKWSETVAFYRDIFKFRINYKADWFVEFEITPDSFLSIADEKRASINSVDGQGITLAWQVDNIQSAHTDLKNQQINVADITTKWGAQVCYLHDPEGHRIELWQPL
jgi:catechol 2,3-dioxygenase-like lactoylglutathione lyase family enzyme